MAIPTWLWSEGDPIERNDRSESNLSTTPSIVSPRTVPSPSSSPQPARSRSGTRPICEDGDESEPGEESEVGPETEIEGEIDAGTETDCDLERVSNDLEVLANPVRLEIMDTLARSERPLRYSELRAALSIRDNGKLNYHLRTLKDLVVSADGEYRLTARGRELVARVLDEGVAASRSRETSRKR